MSKEPSINDVGNCEGAGVRNWTKWPTDSAKKLLTMGRGVSKIRQKCRRRLWMVPKELHLLSQKDRFDIEDTLPSLTKWVENHFDVASKPLYSISQMF